jgi:dTMP kinase
MRFACLAVSRLQIAESMANSQPAPVFIDFEGIDGSGKTTLSNRLAEILKAQGVPVHHARDGGVFRSEISKEIRNLTRDPRFLRMSNVTELLLYVARDTQMIDEFIRPKLLPGNVVFSDRYLYSAITHSHHARGLPREQVNAVVDIAARGLWPDLVVYCDVDPLTSRLRKKIQKVRDGRLGDFGRKGLMGIGFREEMRRGFQELAREDPERWLVVDNASGTIQESLERIYARVAALLDARGFGPLRRLSPRDFAFSTAAPAATPTAPAATPTAPAATPTAPAPTPTAPAPTPTPPAASAPVPAATAGGSHIALAAGNGRPRPLKDRVAEVLSLSDPEARKGSVVRAFFDDLHGIAVWNPSYAAVFLCGLDIPEAHDLREELLDRESSLIAFGLQGLRSPRAMDFRRRLMEREKVYVARSLCGLPELPEFTSLREELVDRVPGHIALSVRGLDTEMAWRIRERAGKKAAREILMGLRGIDTERAWEYREDHAKEQLLPALLEGLGGLDTERAWKWRHTLSDEYLPWTLMSLRGVYSPEAWALREEHVERAPKIVVKSLGRSEDPRAWKVREHAKHYAKEVLDSLAGVDSSRAWALRLELKDKWPNTAVSSLGAGAQSERAWKFRWDMLRENPANLLLVKHIVKATLRTVEAEDDFDDEDDDGDLT